MIRINVDGVTATVTEKEILTAGRVGLECAFTFTGEWEGLFKTAVFQGVESVDVALPDNTCTVPWEAMQVEGVQLKIGVFGANGAGTIVIPTIWANAGKIQPSAAGSGTEPSEPSQNANAYAVETAEEAKNIALAVQQRADDGEFDGADGTDGADGFSPSASVSKVGFVSTITITDKDGTTTATVLDGATGPRGADGVSPSALVSKVGDTATITITDQSGTTEAEIHDGATGATGPQGPAGPGVPAGGTTGQVLKKASGTDYDGEWADDDPYIVQVKTERGTLVRGKYNNNLAYKDNCRRTTHLLSVVPGAQIKISGDWTAEPTITIFKYDANGEFVSGVTTYDTVYTVPSDAAYIKPHMRWDADVDGEYTLTVISNKPIATAMNPCLGSAEEDPSVGVSSESFYFETEPGFWTTARLVLPPNYTIGGAPVPLLVYAHGGSDFINKIVDGEITAHAWDRPAFHQYETAAKYFRAEGFALLDVYGWTTKYQPEWDNLTSSSWPIPTTIKAYKSGIKWVLDRWNLDANAVHLWCKSLGGELSRVFANDPDVDFKTISMLAPALDMLSTGSFGYTKDNAAIIASEFGMVNAANYLTTNYGTTRSAAGRAFFEANKYAFSNFNPGWFFDDVPVSEKLRASMGKSYIYSGKAAHSRCPVKIWVAQDDAIIPFEKCAEYAAQLKIGGCKVYFRVWPNNAGGHKMSMDDVAGAPYRHDYVTALGITVEDVGEEYHEIVEFIRGNRYGEMFDRSVNAACVAYPTPMATGATVQITDGADREPLKELSVLLPYTGTKYTSVTLTRANSDSSDVETLTIPLYESYDVYGGSLDVVHGVLTSAKAAGGTDLGSPVTYQLLPSNLHTVLGENNFSTDAGDLSLTYRADPTMYGNHAAPSAGEFYATYGVTTSAEIEAALQDGKICACVYSGRIYYLGYRASATGHGFYCAIDGTSLTTVYRIYCNNGTWTNSSHSSIRKPSSPTAGNVLKYDGSDWAAANLSASDVGAVATAQGVGHAGEFLVVGSDGNVTTVTMTAWSGGNY